MITTMMLFFLALQLPSGDWPEPRQNAHLTAIQPLPGRMSSPPACLARYDLGRSAPAVTWMPMSDWTDPIGLAIVSGALHGYTSAGELRWKVHPQGLNFESISAWGDLNGDGNREALLQAGRPGAPYAAAVMVSLDTGAILWRYDVEPMSYAWYLYADDFLPSPSREIVVIMQGYPPDEANGYMALFHVPEAGTVPVQKWRYDFDKYTCFPTFHQADLDGDGIKELAVQTHSRMWLMDANTGSVKQFLEWDVSPANVRSYGFTGFTDLDRDGFEDFLCVADFAQHHEVLLNRKGRLELAWTHGWEESVTTGKVETVWTNPPYADLDGDGSIEITLSMFNSENEQAWLLRVYDAVSGTLKYRLPGMVIAGIADLDGNGKAELLVYASDDPTRSIITAMHVLEVRDSALESIWSDPAARIKTASQRGTVSIQRDGSSFVLERDQNGNVELIPGKEAEHKASDQSFTVPDVTGPPLPVLLAADVTGDQQNELLLYSEPNVKILKVNGGTIERIAAFESSSTPVLTDINLDGCVDLVLSQVRPEAPPRVFAVSLAEGATYLWEHELPPADRAGLPQPRTAYMRAARFSGQAEPDLYLWAGTPVVRSIVLEGRTGKVLWEKGELPGMAGYWGPSVNLASAFDINRDGKEDLVFTNPDYYCAASGETGELLVGPEYPPRIFNQPSQGLYTMPVLLARRDAEPLVCLTAGHYFQGVMSLEAAPLWHTLPRVGENRTGYEGFLQLDNGDWLMGFGRQNGMFACIHVLDGTVRWEFPLGAAASDIVTGDVDGDGMQEFVFGTSHGAVYCLGDNNGVPRLLWQLDCEAPSGTPILADVTGDGSIEIIVATKNGYVLIYGNATE